MIGAPCSFCHHSSFHSLEQACLSSTTRTITVFFKAYNIIISIRPFVFALPESNAYLNNTARIFALAGLFRLLVWRLAGIRVA